MSKGGPNLRSGGLSQGTFNIRGRRLGGKYEIIREIGSGGMGKVYLAYEAPVNRYVAVKILHPSYFLDARTVERFFQEAKVCLQLRHPNTTAVFDFGSTGEGLHYMVMELLKGRSLFEILEQHQRVELPWAVRITTQICDSLGEAHRLGVVHRDLKPENVFVEPRPGHPAFVKVLDFGIAKDLSDSKTSSGMTQPGEVFGTPTYMSPEQAGGSACDGRSDIYALGVILYEMLAGVPPFQGPPLHVLMAHVNDPPPELPKHIRSEIPEGISALIMRMLAKDPDGRPASTREVRSLVLAAAGLKKITRRGVRSALGYRPVSKPMSPDAPPEFTKCSISVKNVASGNASRLVRSGQTGGILIATEEPVERGDRMVLISDDAGLPQARLIVDVVGFSEADGQADCPVLQWVRIVCAAGLDELQTILTVLGIEHDITLEGDLGPEDFLVYEPLTERIRRVTLGA